MKRKQDAGKNNIAVNSTHAWSGNSPIAPLKLFIFSACYKFLL
ncbi:hypothetical protein [Niallia sp. 03133]